jgi:hypothetical protein
MKRQIRIFGLAAGLALAVILPGTAGAAPAHHVATKKHQPNPETIVRTYFTILNAGMQSGDFSALSTVYAPGATLTQSNPAGVTKVFQGIAAITGFYQAAYLKFKGYQWSSDTMLRLSPTVVLSYEHAGLATQAVPGRCSHLFTVKGKKIQSLNWVTFYAGQ